MPRGFGTYGEAHITAFNILWSQSQNKGSIVIKRAFYGTLEFQWEIFPDELDAGILTCSEMSREVFYYQYVGFPFVVVPEKAKDYEVEQR